MDITSKLEKVVNYTSYLEERMRELEKESKRSAEAMAVMEMNESQLCNDEGTASSCESSIDDCYGPNESLPEVKVRISKKEVLIIIHCEKQKGIMLKILTQLENLQLSVVSSSVLPFGELILAITIVAQVHNFI